MSVGLTDMNPTDTTMEMGMVQVEDTIMITGTATENMVEDTIITTYQMRLHNSARLPSPWSIVHQARMARLNKIMIGAIVRWHQTYLTLLRIITKAAAL